MVLYSVGDSIFAEKLSSALERWHEQFYCFDADRYKVLPWNPKLDMGRATKSEELAGIIAQLRANPLDRYKIRGRSAYAWPWDTFEEVRPPIPMAIPDGIGPDILQAAVSLGD